MNAAILAATMLFGAGASPPAPGPAAALREARRAAHRAGEPARELEFIVREIAALDAAGGDSPQHLAALCDAVQAGFQVCGERLPERGCEAEYLQRYGDAGCLRDPLQEPRYHYMWADHWRRQMNFSAALAALRRAV